MTESNLPKQTLATTVTQSGQTGAKSTPGWAGRYRGIPKPVRGTVNTLHLILGLGSGLLVIIVALTGCIWAFEEEIRYISQHDELFVAEQSAPRLLPSRILVAVKAAEPSAHITQIRLFADANRATQVYTKDRQLLTLNPYTGQLLSRHDQESDWLAVNLRLHRSLLLGDIGKRIVYWNTWVFLAMLLTGLVLWLPARLQQLRAGLIIKRGAKPAKLTYDLHSVLGFYTIPALLVIGVTGIIIGTPNDRKKEKPVTYQKLASPQMIDKAVSSAVQTDEFETVRVSLPKDEHSPLRVQVSYPTSGLRKESVFLYDPGTGKRTKANLYQQMTFGTRFWQSDTEIHTGRMLGLTGKFLAFLASLVAVSMPITGFMMWRNRQQKKRKPAVDRQTSAAS